MQEMLRNSNPSKFYNNFIYYVLLRSFCFFQIQIKSTQGKVVRCTLILKKKTKLFPYKIKEYICRGFYSHIFQAFQIKKKPFTAVKEVTKTSVFQGLLFFFIACLCLEQ